MLVINIQGLLWHIDELKLLMVNKRPGIVCITESHLTADVSEHEYVISNYSNVKMYSKSSRTGGVVIYVRKDINYDVINNVVDNPNQEVNMWMRSIKLKGLFENIIISNIYHSPNQSNGIFIERLMQEYENLSDKGQVIFVGDFNIDVSKDSQYSRKLIKVMKSVGLHQWVGDYTRVTSNSKTMIDLIFSNEVRYTKVLEVPRISDHFIVKMSLPIYKNKEKSNNKNMCIKYKRDYSRFNINELRKNLCTLYKELCIENSDYKDGSIDVKIQFLTDVILDSINVVAPVKEFIVKKKWESCKWFNDHIKQLISIRDSYYKEFKSKRNNVEWEKYKRLRNLVVTEIRRAKKQYYEKLVDCHKNNSKKLWKNMKFILGNKNQLESKTEIIFNKEKVSDNIKIADKFNKFFVQNVEKIVKQIDKSNNDDFVYDGVVIRLNELEEVEESEIDEIVKKLDKNKGKGSIISNDIIDKIWKVNKVVIREIVNCCLKLSKIPGNWKNSLIHPIPKVKGTNVAEDFRPINTLPELEKIVEQVVKNRLLKHLDRNGILKEEQSGFRKHHSCETALQKIMCEWRNEIDKGNMIGAVLLDLSKAFETLNIPRLIEKLRMYGIGGGALEWFQNYLEDRTQQVKFGDAISVKIKVKYGVPQGSILGPLLFILYINDIVDVAKEYGCQCKLFADDKMLYFVDKDEKVIELILNKTLKKLEIWLNCNSLKFNSKKTVCMLFRDRKKKNVNHLELVLAGQKIEQCTEAKYLGIMLDEFLTFTSHTFYIVKKVNARINLMYRLSKFISDYTTVLIYKSMIAPYFDYCSTLLLNINDECMKMLQKCQNRAMRIILRVDRYTPIRCMLDALCFLSIEERVQFNVCVFVYKMTNNLMPEYLNRIAVNYDHRYSTRYKNRLMIQRTRTKTADKSINMTGFSLFNKLSKVTKEAKNLVIFKKLLREELKTIRL